jgi:hypothetical protein
MADAEYMNSSHHPSQTPMGFLSRLRPGETGGLMKAASRGSVGHLIYVWGMATYKVHSVTSIS